MKNEVLLRGCDLRTRLLRPLKLARISSRPITLTPILSTGAHEAQAERSIATCATFVVPVRKAAAQEVR